MKLLQLLGVYNEEDCMMCVTHAYVFRVILKHLNM